MAACVECAIGWWCGALANYARLHPFGKPVSGCLALGVVGCDVPCAQSMRRDEDDIIVNTHTTPHTRHEAHCKHKATREDTRPFTTVNATLPVTVDTTCPKSGRGVDEDEAPEATPTKLALYVARIVARKQWHRKFSTCQVEVN